jgi:hypothetical protein
MLNLQNMIIAVGVALVVGFGSGWQVHGWKIDSENAAIKQAAAQVEQAVAATLEKKLSQLKANQTVVRHETEKVIERPIYNNVCIDDDGVRIINLSKDNATKLAGPVP